VIRENSRRPRPEIRFTSLSLTPGVVEHDLFPPHSTSEILVVRASNIRRVGPLA
jgi:hypothetical protein